MLFILYIHFYFIPSTTEEKGIVQILPMALQNQRNAECSKFYLVQLEKDNISDIKWASNMKIHHLPQITITGILTKCFLMLWASQIDPFSSPFIWCLFTKRCTSILQMHNWIKKKPQKQQHQTDCRIKWWDRKEEEKKKKTKIYVFTSSKIP